jgi:hypothetical protein
LCLYECSPWQIRKTVKEYIFDLDHVFKFIKFHKGLTNNIEFNEISIIKDVDLNLIKSLYFTDLYEFLNILPMTEAT